ncbi:MAG TPA: helix-turn-helix domain-containing protein [Anaerolineaceae bacterium]|jgi:excisionase family DNA binding protein|nr:helix-turn-helix domain-containing protein [Anaerolineaceae bacterium]
MADTDEFWTAEEVSNYLRIPQSTIYKLAQDKVLPGFKVGKHWRFRRETILEWIKTREGKVSSFIEGNIQQFKK